MDYSNVCTTSEIPASAAFASLERSAAIYIHIHQIYTINPVLVVTSSNSHPVFKYSQSGTLYNN